MTLPPHTDLLFWMGGSISTNIYLVKHNVREVAEITGHNDHFDECIKEVRKNESN